MFLDYSQSKLALNPSLAAKDSGIPEKTLNAKTLQETLHIEQGSTSVSNKGRQDKRQETRNASSHKLKV